MRRTIPDYTGDGLKRRLADLERQVADLNRKGEAPAAYVEPPEVAAAGGSTGTFKAFHPDTTYTATNGTLTGFDWTNWGYYSAGVSGLGPGGVVTLPEGLWVVTMALRLQSYISPAGVVPTTGTLSLGMNSSPDGDYPNQQFSHGHFPQTTNTSHVTGHFIVPEGSTKAVTFKFSNTFDTDIRVVNGWAVGTMVGPPPAVTYAAGYA